MSDTSRQTGKAGKQVVRRRGRPPAAAEERRNDRLTLGIKPSLRKKLESCAVKNGRSISAEAEIRLEMTGKVWGIQAVKTALSGGRGDWSSIALRQLLDTGWEPFAVAEGHIWLKKQDTVDDE